MERKKKIVRDNVRYVHIKVNFKDKHCVLFCVFFFLLYEQKDRQADYYSSRECAKINSK